MQTVKKLLKKYNTIPVAAKATIWFIFASTLQKGMSLITTPIFTRIMSTEQYGQYSVYNSWLQILTIITTLRLNWAVFNKGMSKYKNDRDVYAATMQSVTFMLTMVVFAIYLIFHRQINDITELPTFIMVAIFAELLVTPAIDFWSLRKRYEYQYKPVVFRTVLFTFVNAGVGVIAVMLSEEKGYARIMTCVAVNIVFGLSLFVYNYIKAKRLFKFEYAKFAISFNLPLLLHYISQYILDQFDRVMIQKMVDVASAGIYSVAYNAGMLLKIITQSINNALVPWQYEKLEKKEFKELDDVLFLVYLLVGSCCLVFSAFAPELMRILADDKYYEAVYAIPPVTLGLFFMYMYTTIANVEFFYDQNKFTMYISMSGAFLNVVLNYIGIKMFGYLAAAYTTMICYILFAVGHYIYMTVSVKKFLGVDQVFDTRRIVALSLGILFCGIVVMFLYDYAIIRYILIAVIVAVGFFKRTMITSMFKKVKKKK